MNGFCCVEGAHLIGLLCVCTYHRPRPSLSPPSVTSSRLRREVTCPSSTRLVIRTYRRCVSTTQYSIFQSNMHSPSSRTMTGSTAVHGLRRAYLLGWCNKPFHSLVPRGLCSREGPVKTSALEREKENSDCTNFGHVCCCTHQSISLDSIEDSHSNLWCCLILP
jgi:hypothetical protein